MMRKSSANVTKQVKIDLADVTISDAERKSSLRILGVRLGNNSNEALKTSEKKKCVYDIINMLKMSKNVEVQESAFWSLAQATAIEFDEKMIAEFVTCLDIACQDSKSIGKCYEACNFLQRIIKENKENLKKHSEIIAGCLLRMVVHPVTKIRETSYLPFQDFLPVLLNSQSQVAPHLSRMIANGSFVNDCLHLSKNSNQGVYVLTVMDPILLLLKEELWSGQSILKSFVPIIERGFKARNCEELKAAFVVWKTLIEVISQDLDILTDPKRIKFILQPVRVRLLKYPTVLPAFQNAYWTLIIKLKDRLPPYFEKLVVPLFETVLCCSLEESGTVMSSVPPPSKGEKNLPMVQIAGQMLIRISELPTNPSTKLVYPTEKLVLTVPELAVPMPLSILLHNFKKLVKASKHVMFALGKNKENALLLEMLFISLLRASSYTLDKANKFSVEAVSLLLSLVDEVINDEAIPPNLCLKFIENFANLPSFILTSHYCHLGHNTVMHNDLAVSLVTLLLKPHVFSVSRKESSFRSAFKCLVSTNILETSSALIYAQMFLDLINDKKLMVLTEPEDLLLMWCDIAISLLEAIKKTHEVNQGDSLENDFSCLYNILLYPISHFLPPNVTKESFDFPLKYWTELYKLLIEYAPPTSSMETNVICEEFCQKLKVSVKQDLLQNELYFEVLCSMVKVIIDNLDFESINQKQDSHDTQNSLADQNKKKPLGNVTAVTNLNILLMQAFYEKLSTHEKQYTEFRKESMFETPELSKYSMLFDLIKNFCCNIKNSSLVPPLISSIAKPLSKLFLMSHEDESGNSQLSSKMSDLWKSISTNIVHYYNSLYDEAFIKILNPIFQSTHDHACSDIVNASKTLWLATFEPNQSSLKCTKNIKNSISLWAKSFSFSEDNTTIGSHENVVGEKDATFSSKETLGLLETSFEKSKSESKNECELDNREISEDHSKDLYPESTSSNFRTSLGQKDSLCPLNNQANDDALFVKPVTKIVSENDDFKNDSLEPFVPEVVDISTPDADVSASFCFDVTSVVHNETNSLLCPADDVSLIDAHEHNYSQTSAKNPPKKIAPVFRRTRSKQRAAANLENEVEVIDLSVLDVKELSADDTKAPSLLTIENKLDTNETLEKKNFVCAESKPAVSKSSDQQISSTAKLLGNSTNIQNADDNSASSETLDCRNILDDPLKRTSEEKLNEILTNEKAIGLSETSTLIAALEIENEPILKPINQDDELKHKERDEIDEECIKNIHIALQKPLPILKKNDESEEVDRDEKTNISDVSAVNDELQVNATDDAVLDDNNKCDSSIKPEINPNIEENNLEISANPCSSMDPKDVIDENSDGMTYEHNYSQTIVTKKRKRRNVLSSRKSKPLPKSQNASSSADNEEPCSQNSELKPEIQVAASEVKSPFSIVFSVAKIEDNHPPIQVEADNNVVTPSEKNTSFDQEKSLENLNETNDDHDEMNYSSQEIFSDPPSDDILKSDTVYESNIVKNNNLSTSKNKRNAKRNSQLNISDSQINTRSLRSPRKRGSPLWLQDTIRPSLGTKRRMLNSSSISASSDEGSPAKKCTNVSSMWKDLSGTSSTESKAVQNHTPAKIKQDKVKEIIDTDEKVVSEEDGFSLKEFAVKKELPLQKAQTSTESTETPKHSKSITNFQEPDIPGVQISNSAEKSNFNQDEQDTKTLELLSEELKEVSSIAEVSGPEVTVPKKRKRRSVYAYRRNRRQSSTPKLKKESCSSQSSQDSLVITEFPVPIQDEQSVFPSTMDAVEILAENNSSKTVEKTSDVNFKYSIKDNCDIKSIEKSVETLPKAIKNEICESTEKILHSSHFTSSNIMNVGKKKLESNENENCGKPVKAEVDENCESNKDMLPPLQTSSINSVSMEEVKIESDKNKNMHESVKISCDDISNKNCDSSEDILPPSPFSCDKSINVYGSKNELSEKMTVDILLLGSHSSSNNAVDILEGTESKHENQTVKAESIDETVTLPTEASTDDSLSMFIAPSTSSRMMQTRSRTGVNKDKLQSETLKGKLQRKKKVNSTLSYDSETSSLEKTLNMDPQISLTLDDTNAYSAANIDLNKANSDLNDYVMVKPMDDLILSQKETLDEKLYEVAAVQNLSEVPNSIDNVRDTLINSEILNDYSQELENKSMSLEAEVSNTETTFTKKQKKRKSLFMRRKNKKQQEISKLVDSENSQDMKRGILVSPPARHYKQSILSFITIAEKSQYSETYSNDCEVIESDNLPKIISDGDISRTLGSDEMSNSQLSCHTSEGKALEKLDDDEIEEACGSQTIQKVESTSLVNETRQLKILSTLPSRTLRTRRSSKAREKGLDKLDLKAPTSRRKSTKKCKDSNVADISIIEKTKTSLDTSSKSPLSGSPSHGVTDDKEIYDDNSEPDNTLGDVDIEKDAIVVEKQMLPYDHLGTDQITADVEISNFIKKDGVNLNNSESPGKDGLISSVFEQNVSLDNELPDSQTTLSKAPRTDVLTHKKNKNRQMNSNLAEESRSNHESSVKTQSHKQSTLPFIAISDIKNSSVLILDKNVDESSISSYHSLTLDKNLEETSANSGPSKLDKNSEEASVSNNSVLKSDKDLGESSVSDTTTLKLDKVSGETSVRSDLSSMSNKKTESNPKSNDFSSESSKKMKSISINNNSASKFNPTSDCISKSNNSTSMLNQESDKSFKNSADSNKCEPVPCEIPLKIVQDGDENNASNSSDDILPSSQFSDNNSLRIYTPKAELVKQLNLEKENIHEDQLKLAATASSRTVKTRSYSALKTDEDHSKSHVKKLTSETKSSKRKKKVSFSIASEDTILNIKKSLLDLCSEVINQVDNGSQGMEDVSIYSVDNADQKVEYSSNETQDLNAILIHKAVDNFEVDNSQCSITSTQTSDDPIPDSQEIDIEPVTSSSQIIVSKKRKRKVVVGHKKGKTLPKQKVLKTKVDLKLDTVDDEVPSSTAESSMQVQHESPLCSVSMEEKTTEVYIPGNVKKKLDKSTDSLINNCNEENEPFMCKKLDIIPEPAAEGICDMNVGILNDTYIQPSDVCISKNEDAESKDHMSSQFANYSDKNSDLQLTTASTNPVLGVLPTSSSKILEINLSSDVENVEKNVPHIQMPISEEDKSCPSKVESAVISSEVTEINNVVSSNITQSIIMPRDVTENNDIIPNHITENNDVKLSDIIEVVDRISNDVANADSVSSNDITMVDMSRNATAICETKEVALDQDSKTLSTFYEHQVNSSNVDNFIKPSTACIDLQPMEVAESVKDTTIVKKRISSKKVLRPSKFIRNSIGEKISTSAEVDNLHSATTNSKYCYEISEEFQKNLDSTVETPKFESENKQNIVFTCSSHLKVVLDPEKDSKNKNLTTNRITLNTLESILPLQESAMSFIASARQESVNIHSYEMKISADSPNILKNNNDSSESSHCKKALKVLPNKNIKKSHHDVKVSSAKPSSSNIGLFPHDNISKSPTSRGTTKIHNRKNSPFLSLKRSPTSRSEAMLQASQSKRLRQEEAAKKQKVLSPGMVLNEMQKSSSPSTPKSSKSQSKFQFIRFSQASSNESVSEENSGPVVVKSILKKLDEGKPFLQKKASKKVHFTEPSPEEKYRSSNVGMTFSDRVKLAKAKRLSRKAAKTAKLATQNKEECSSTTTQSPQPSPRPQSNKEVSGADNAKHSSKMQSDQEVPELFSVETSSKEQSEKVPDVHTGVPASESQFLENISKLPSGILLKKLDSPTIPTLNEDLLQSSDVTVGKYPISTPNNQLEAKEIVDDSTVNSGICEAGPSSSSDVRQFDLSDINLDGVEREQLIEFIDRLWPRLHNIPILRILSWQEELQKLLKRAVEKQLRH